MSFFKIRSDYFKQLAIKNKLIAHTAVVGGESRNAFHRMNDEEELVAACANFAHFPCVVIFSIDGRYTGDKNAVPKRKLNNALLFLAKVDEMASMDQRETAYDTAFEIMEQFISKMYNEFSVDGCCCNFSNIDLGRFSFAPYGPVNATLFGWLLQFEDEQYPNSILQFDPSKWNE
jgi:hypothetical protein